MITLILSDTVIMLPEMSEKSYKAISGLYSVLATWRKKEMLWLVFFEFSYTLPNVTEELLKMLAIKLKFLNIHILPLREILKLKAVKELVKLKRQPITEHYGS